MHDRDMVDQIKPMFMREMLKADETRPVAEVAETVDILFDALKECFDQHTAYECSIIHSFPIHDRVKIRRSQQVSPEKLNGDKVVVWERTYVESTNSHPHLVAVRNNDKNWMYRILINHPGCGFREEIVDELGFVEP